jgi:EmrB/QacA subfamily drug resistance transporter
VTRSNASGSTPARPVFLLALLSAAQLMVIVDVTIVNVALPAIAADLDMPPADLSWVVNAYAIVLGGFLLLGGRASDLFGRRAVFLAGVVLFTIGSLASGLAPGGGALIASRAVQGLGAALVSPAALALLLASFEPGPPRNRALGIWAAVAGAGIALGAALGGVLTELLSWRWTFLINVPIGAMLVPLVLRHVRESRSDQATGLDLPGAALVTGGLVVLVYAIVGAEEHGFGAPRTLALAGAAALLLISFVVVERRSAQPLVRLSIFRVRALASADAAYLVVALGMFGPLILLSLYLQQILGLTALEAGLAFLPYSIAFAIVASFAPRIVLRYGVKPPLLAGLTLGVASTALFGLIRADGTVWLDVIPATVLSAVGFGLTLTPLTIAATSGVPTRDAGLASGLFNSAQEVGAALGIAIFISIATAVAGDQPGPVAVVEGYQVAFLVGAALIAAAALAVALLLRARDLPRTAVGAGAHG